MKAHPVRAKILRRVQQRPGSSISELCGSVGLSWGAAQHHLQLLESTGLIRCVTEGRSRRLFVGSTGEQTANQIALLRRARLLDLVRAVLDRPGLVQREISGNAGLSRKMIRTYTDLLVGAGLVVEVRGERALRYYPTLEVARLVRAIDAPRASQLAKEPQEPAGPSR